MHGFNQTIMKSLSIAFSLGMIFFSITGTALSIGDDAPNFHLEDASGKKHSLSDYKGKYVVLEWVNYQCPFVRKHYDSKNMQSLQKKFTKKNVVWLSICSSGEDKQGFFSQKKIQQEIIKNQAHCSAYLSDTTGKVGRSYKAKTTPHMFIIDPEGKIIYQGAIDSISSYYERDVAKAKNYVFLALESAMAGKNIEHPITKPYGCSIKYKK